LLKVNAPSGLERLERQLNGSFISDGCIHNELINRATQPFDTEVFANEFGAPQANMEHQRTLYAPDASIPSPRHFRAPISGFTV
jgi:hypothetical protein